MIKNEKTADLALVITAIIWGTGFIVAEYAIGIGASSFLIIAMRFLIAGAVLGVISIKSLKNINKKTLTVGCTAGLILFLGFSMQILGQSVTSVSNSSFITATNVVMVPFIVWIFTKKSPKLKYYILGLTALIGAVVLTIKPGVGFAFNSGDILMLIAAISFATHIAYLGAYGGGLDTKQLTFLQASCQALR